MSRFARILAVLSLAAGIGCEAQLPDEREEITESALTIYTSCSGGALPPNTAEVWFLYGGCRRYAMDPAQPNQFNFIGHNATVGPIQAVHVGRDAAVWVCDPPNPAGATAARYAPCWNGGIDNVFQRIRGPFLNGHYQPSEASVQNNGRSMVLTLGTLPAAPWCDPYYIRPTTNWHPFGGDFSGDSGLKATTANNDPGDMPGSAVTDYWPDGSGNRGAPCTTNALPGIGYAEVYYGWWPAL